LLAEAEYWEHLASAALLEHFQDCTARKLAKAIFGIDKLQAAKNAFGGKVSVNRPATKCAALDICTP
jgi:hypothetical protein